MLLWQRNGPGQMRRIVSAALFMMLAGCNDDGSAQKASQPLDELRITRVAGGEPERGRRIIAAYECGVCHVIPGVQGAHGIVGPPLTGFGRRQFIGGVVPNEPSLLVRWVQDAPSIAPHTGMPDLGLSDEEARHVAAYLYTLR
ncbi:c-type cytochrome [Microvirga arabica]|uniref:c-type cytochrome n=1 Tax=Microvirga arabica TaxID=1128671 RepID=UPI001939A25F|nr:c-type cytochrome [Microvirga arabica]MBM1170022.1 c-type cytochrome [Microvirga arabica]